MEKPKVIVSACLLGYPYRYNGEDVSLKWLKEVSAYVDFIPVCPEVEIGLGVPRFPIKLVKKYGFIRMIQVSTNKDVSNSIIRFSKDFLNRIGIFHGFIGKSKSPSCSLGDAKVFRKVKDEKEIGRGKGLFYSYLKRKRFYIPSISDSDEYEKIDEFFIKVFMLYDLERQGMEEFVKNNLYLLRAFNPYISSSPSLSDILRTLGMPLRKILYIRILKRFVSVPVELEISFLKGSISRQKFADTILDIKNIKEERLVKYLKPYPFKLRL